MLGIIAVADTLKEHSAEAVAELKKMGIETIMLTGDNEKTANAIAKQVGIDRVIANVLPGEKEDVIKKLQAEGKIVAMVGDGINDAPALAQSNIGIAVGSGSDVAKETGGIVLIRDDLRDVVSGIRLSKATMRKIKQNMFWALIYNVLAIPVAAIGLLNPMIAAAAMAMSSLTVVSNSALLRRFKLRREDENEAVDRCWPVEYSSAGDGEIADIFENFSRKSIDDGDGDACRNLRIFFYIAHHIFYRRDVLCKDKR